MCVEHLECVPHSPRTDCITILSVHVGYHHVHTYAGGRVGMMASRLCLKPCPSWCGGDRDSGQVVPGHLNTTAG